MSDIASFTHAGATLIAETAGVSVARSSRSRPPGIRARTSDKPTYVLIHGIGMGRTIFADLVDHLREPASPRDDGSPRAGTPAVTIALDLPGYGEAPEPARVLTVERTADLVAAYLRSRRIGPAVIVGHSMGTQIALEVAVRHPDLVDRIVLIAPTVNPRERTAAQQVLRLAQDLLVESPRVMFVGAREYLRAGPHLRSKFRAMLVHRPEDAFPRVRVPALVLRGENDYVCPREWCRLVAASIPDGRLAEVEGHGHETMIRDASPAAALIREFVGTGRSGRAKAAFRTS
jgi:pimeloyl-ACP methyl ester carboxylesterase